MPYLLDTNALSEIDKPKPNKGFMDWFDQAIVTDLYTSCLTLAEVYKGIELLADTPKRKQLQARSAQIRSSFDGRILMIDLDTALLWSKLVAKAQQAGKTAPAIDSLIAAQCIQNQMTLVTRNTKDFEQFKILEVLSPWSS